jgi:hypothetical protein
MIEGSERANIIFSKGTRFIIDNALFSTKSRRNLLSFKDIHHNRYYIETTNENDKYLHIVSNVSTKKNIGKIIILSSGLYYTSISTIKTNAIMNQKFNKTNNFIIWHDKLGHPRLITIRRIIENSYGHPLKNKKIL